MGGGSDGDYQQQQAATEAKKAAARLALNYKFGVGNGVDPAQFNRNDPIFSDVTMDEGGAMQRMLTGQRSWFDQAGYDAANAAAGENPNAAAREKLYDTVRTNAFDAGKRGLDESRDAAARNLKFELFARGLNGGSEDINQNALMGRKYDQGILDLGAKADGARADLRSADEATRLGLLQSIDAGMDQSSALSSAINQMGVNSDKAAAAAQGTTLGNLFDDAGALYNVSQARMGKQAAATDWWNQYSTSSGKSNKATTGIVNSVP